MLDVYLNSICHLFAFVDTMSGATTECRATLDYLFYVSKPFEERSGTQ